MGHSHSGSSAGNTSDPTQIPSTSKDPQDYVSFLPSNEDEPDSSVVDGGTVESLAAEDETVSSLRQRITELMAQKEKLKEDTEAQKAQVTFTRITFIFTLAHLSKLKGKHKKDSSLSFGACDKLTRTVILMFIFTQNALKANSYFLGV